MIRAPGPRFDADQRRALWVLAESGPMSEAQYRQHRAAIEARTVTYRQISAKTGIRAPRSRITRRGGSPTPPGELRPSANHVLAALAAGDMTRRQLQEATGYTNSTLGSALAQLQTRGAVRISGTTHVGHGLTEAAP